MSILPRLGAVWLTVAVLAAWTPNAAAQSAGSTTIEGAVGVGLRGPGATAECCGPYRSTLERAKSFWAGAGVGRWVRPRFGVEGEATLAAESPYTAYVQGVFGDEPYRGYRAENRITTITLAALLRGRAARLGQGSLDLVAGLGWTLESRRTHLRSVVFRLTPEPLPDVTFDNDDVRQSGTLVVGSDVAYPAFDSRFDVFATGRVHWRLKGADAFRTDLELGQPVWRFGIGIRRSF